MWGIEAGQVGIISEIEASAVMNNNPHMEANSACKSQNMKHLFERDPWWV
jgi:hypothetical protein